MLTIRPRLLSVAALLALTPFYHAAPAPENRSAGLDAAGLDAEPLHLERVVVSTAPYARTLGEVAQPVSLLEGRRLALRQSTSLGEMLSSEPGVSSTYFGPGASRPVVRGLGGDRLKVLENHIGTIDASTTSPDHAVSLDPLLFDRVEIVRGPAALLYGGNAVGGVVNIITDRIPERVPDALVTGRIIPRTESANREASGGIALDGGLGNVAWHIDGFMRDTRDIKIPGYAESARARAAEHHDHDHDDDGDHDHDAEEEAYGRVPNTAIESDGGSVGLSWIGESFKVGAAWSGFNSFYGVPGHSHAHGDSGHDHDHGHGHDHDDDDDDHDHDGHDHGDDDEHAHGDDVKIDLVQRRFDLQGEIAREFGLLRGAKFKLGVADYRHQELADGQVDTVFKNRGHDARLELLHNPIAGATGAIGGQLSRSRFEAVGDEAFVPPSRTANHALFLFEELPAGPVALQFGGRYEAQKISVRDGTGRSRSDDLVSLSAGGLWRLSEDWSLGLSLARSERGPGVQERYANGPHIGTRAYEIGDAGLGIETSTALDLTLRRRTGRVTGALTGFINRFDGYVFESPTGQVAIAHGDHFHFEDLSHPDAASGLTVYRFAQTDARFLGLEAELAVHLYESTTSRLDLHLATDAVRAKNLKDGGSDLPRITPRRHKVGLDWARGAFALGTELQHVESQHRIAPSELPTDSYALLSVYGSYQLTLGATTWELFARGSNLTDEDARVHTSFLKDVLPLPGRSLSLGLRMSF